MNKLSTSIVNCRYLFYFHIHMENSELSSHSLLEQIVHRYLERHYPLVSHLTPLSLSNHLASSPRVHKAKEPRKQATENIPQESEGSSSTDAITVSQEPQLPPLHHRRKASSWEYFPPHTDFSKIEILRLSYRTLQPYVLSSPLDIPCRIFVDEEKNDEILFFNRLAKILTQQVFPTTLICSIRNKDIFQNHEDFPLSLAPLTMIRYKISHARYHQSFTKNGSTWIPIYSSVYYENDPQLKRDLWALLNHLPFAYTQKSS